MKRLLLTVGAAAMGLGAPAAADPGKDESGKGRERGGWEEAGKAAERAFEHQKKALERAAKWEEERGKAYEKALERREKFEEKRFEAAMKAAEREDKAAEKAFERAERLARFRSRDNSDQQDWERAFARRAEELRLARVGERLTRGTAYDQVPSWLNGRYVDSDDYYYRYDDDGYLYRVDRNDGLVGALIPLLGGGLSIGQVLPANYALPVPTAFSDVYRDSDEALYRYGDGAIYQVDPANGVIESIVALLTGNTFDIGSRLPAGYDIYNVPLAYRDEYYDTADAWYRYNDGYIYQVDPQTRLITAIIDAIV